LRFHANDHIEKFFTLNDLRRSLSTDCGLNDGFDIGDVDAVARDFGTVSVNDQAGLTEFANDG